MQLAPAAHFGYNDEKRTPEKNVHNDSKLTPNADKPHKYVVFR